MGMLPFQGGIANLWWYADPTSEVAAIIFNSVLPYGSECLLHKSHGAVD